MGWVSEGFRRVFRQAGQRHVGRTVPMPLPFFGRSIRAVELGGGFFVQNRAEFTQESVALEVFFP